MAELATYATEEFAATTPDVNLNAEIEIDDLTDRFLDACIAFNILCAPTASERAH